MLVATQMFIISTAATNQGRCLVLAAFMATIKYQVRMFILFSMCGGAATVRTANKLEQCLIEWI